MKNARKTLGSEALVLEMRVVSVRTVVMPRATRAGTAPRSSQNDIHDRTTIRLDGM